MTIRQNGLSGRLRGVIGARISEFAMISLLLHVGLVALLSALAMPSTGPSGIETRPVLSVKLVFSEPAHQMKLGPSKSTSPRKSTAREAGHSEPSALQTGAIKMPNLVPAPLPLPVPPDSSSLPAEQVASSTSQETAGANTRTSLNGQAARAQIRTLLLNDFARRFAYPPIARQRGWGGRVLLSVTVDPQGLLKAIHVLRTSGYDVLDRSAVETMRKIQRLADAQPWLGDNDLRIELPVIYRLRN